ncbi:hypothetical protein KM043_008422 [Ampulex compressa]|nr:hypothetical protein KM043_008422 [Ampulex compressa]
MYKSSSTAATNEKRGVSSVILRRLRKHRAASRPHRRVCGDPRCGLRQRSPLRAQSATSREPGTRDEDRDVENTRGERHMRHTSLARPDRAPLRSGVREPPVAVRAYVQAHVPPKRSRRQ